MRVDVRPASFKHSFFIVSRRGCQYVDHWMVMSTSLRLNISATEGDSRLLSILESGQGESNGHLIDDVT